MKSHHIRSIFAIVSAALVVAASSIVFVHSALGDDGKAAKRSEADSSYEEKGATRSDDGELRFEGVEFDPDSFIVDDFLDIIKYRKLRENMSGGLTSEGVNFSITW